VSCGMYPGATRIAIERWGGVRSGWRLWIWKMWARCVLLRWRTEGEG
jgi:hypothetical protein